jgi:nucleotide-binding universal stress UspA family protein
MASGEKKKILVALDGSENALGAVRYLCATGCFKDAQVILYHVFSCISAHFWDLERNPKYGEALSQVQNWESSQRKSILDAMETAKGLLVSAGYPEEAVSIRVEDRDKGFARDIIAEGLSGYEAVLLGRKGTGTLADISIGSVALKIIEKLFAATLLVANPQPLNSKVLIALDGSENSMRAVDFVARGMGAGPGRTVGLINVIRGQNDSSWAFKEFFAPKECMLQAEQEILTVFEEARARLEKAGFDPKDIAGKVVTGAASRAGSIVAESREAGYGAIVMGRRGLSRVEEFYMGRVSNKVLTLAKDACVVLVA